MPRQLVKPTPVELFEVLPEHVLLLRHAYVGWDPCETGAPAIDPKRPYGNSDVALDMARILGVTVTAPEDLPAVLTRLWNLHAGTQTALQIFLVTGRMEPGLYRKTGYGKDWVRVAEDTSQPKQLT